MTEIVERIVRRLETNPDAARTGVKVDWTSFANAREADATRVELEELCAAGVLKASYGKGGFRNVIERVSVVDAALLFSRLERTPAAQVAREAVSGLRSTASEWETDVIDEIERKWSTHRKWQGFTAADVVEVTAVARVARAIHAGLHEGLDMRTLSSRHGDDSKLIERNEAAILEYRYHGSVRPEGTLREIVDKITMPLLLSGPFAYDGHPVGDLMEYCGVPTHRTESVSLRGRPSYVLTVENLASFHRHAVEVNADRSGLVIYTGGHGSRAFRSFYARMAREIGDSVPFFHWSDIDAGGLEITLGIMAMKPDVRPHLMDVELVRAFGSRQSAAVSQVARFSSTWLEPLAVYLSRPGTATLEQEALDPVSPFDAGRDRSDRGLDARLGL